MTHLGFGLFHYEGADTSACFIPVSCVDVLVMTYSSRRGIAIAIDWRSTVRGTMYVNTLHTDTSDYSWQGWMLRGLAYNSYSGDSNLYVAANGTSL